MNYQIFQIGPANQEIARLEKLLNITPAGEQKPFRFFNIKKANQEIAALQDKCKAAGIDGSLVATMRADANAKRSKLEECAEVAGRVAARVDQIFGPGTAARITDHPTSYNGALALSAKLLEAPLSGAVTPTASLLSQAPVVPKVTALASTSTPPKPAQTKPAAVELHGRARALAAISVEGMNQKATPAPVQTSSLSRKQMMALASVDGCFNGDFHPGSGTDSDPALMSDATLFAKIERLAYFDNCRVSGMRSDAVLESELGSRPAMKGRTRLAANAKQSTINEVLNRTK